MNPEKALEKSIEQWLDAQGFYCVKVQSGRMLAVYNGKKRAIKLAPAGTPDLHCIMNGYGVCIEVKRDPKKAAEWKRVVSKYIDTGVCCKSHLPIVTQYECHKRIEGRNARGLVLVVGSIEELKKKLKMYRFLRV